MTRPFDPADLPTASRLPTHPSLPDPIETVDGDPVETVAAWRERRAEILQLFRHYVYGYAPDVPEVETDVEREVEIADGAVTLVETRVEFADLPADAPAIRMALFVSATGESGRPSGAGENPVPVVLGINSLGNHTTIDDDSVTRTGEDGRAGAGERGGMADSWCVEHVVERGYAFATFHQADVAPDVDDFDVGVFPYYDDDLPGPPGTEWGVLAAWAWGLQCCVDALSGTDGTLARVDGERVVVTGHSRRGKAALLAGATDERIALVAPQKSGTGGLALSRENEQETVGGITEEFPHWFADGLAGFGGRPDRLPVDQHLLAACVAPRPLLDTEGARDYWANPGRALDGLRAAGPVWELLGERGVVDGGLLWEGDAITSETAGEVLQFRRDTGHVRDRGYCDAILDFADLHLK